MSAAVTMWKMPIHQFNLWRLERNFQTIAPAHPPGSKLLLKRKDFGGLFSAASHSCDYFIGELRSTPRSKEDVRKAYNGLSIDSFDHTKHIPVEVHFFDEEEFFTDFPWYEWQAELRRSFDVSAARDNLYLIFASQSGYSPYGDLRCY
ncbi:MAG: hypothetical protein HY007_04255 [Candidatus Sungbacteria bacterium]|nr:hypothetical protein [Candidatus Sungbacteria bacterium]